MSRRMWAFAVAAWVAVVIAGSGLTWIAIERAGDQVTATPESAGATRPPVLGTVGPAPTAAAPSRTPTRPTPTAPVTAAPTRTATSAAPSTPATRPSTQPSSQPAPSPAVRPQVRAWSGSAGSLTVACTGRQVSFRSATPSNGWTFERGDGSGEDLEVTFKSGAGEVQVRATCSGGVPQFRVQSDAEHD